MSEIIKIEDVRRPRKIMKRKVGRCKRKKRALSLVRRKGASNKQIEDVLIVLSSISIVKCANFASENKTTNNYSFVIDVMTLTIDTVSKNQFKYHKTNGSVQSV